MPGGEHCGFRVIVASTSSVTSQAGITESGFSQQCWHCHPSLQKGMLWFRGVKLPAKIAQPVPGILALKLRALPCQRKAFLTVVIPSEATVLVAPLPSLLRGKDPLNITFHRGEGHPWFLHAQDLLFT